MLEIRPRRWGRLAVHLLLFLGVATMLFVLAFQISSGNHLELLAVPRRFIRQSTLRQNVPHSDNYFDDDGRNPAVLILAYNRADHLRAVLDRKPRDYRHYQDEENSRFTSHKMGTMARFPACSLSIRIGSRP